MHSDLIYKEYFEDVRLHQQYRSREYLLREKEMLDFATAWHPIPLHIDMKYAQNTKFGCLVASGVHLLSICQKLGNEMQPGSAWTEGLGWEKVQFLAPARSGDVLVLETKVISKRESKSEPDSGIVRYNINLLNQRNELVLTYKGTVMIKKRHKS